MLVIGVLVFCIQLFPYLLKAGKQLLPHSQEKSINTSRIRFNSIPPLFVYNEAVGKVFKNETALVQAQSIRT